MLDQFAGFALERTTVAGIHVALVSKSVTANPWLRLPDSGPYVLADDAEAVGRFNDKPNRKPIHLLRIHDLLPEPFIGSPDAPVVLLSNNPGWSETGLALKQSRGFQQRMRAN